MPIITQREVRMVSLPKRKGWYDSIAYVENYGMCLCNEYQKNNSIHFLEDINEDYVEDDNIKFPLFQ